MITRNLLYAIILCSTYVPLFGHVFRIEKWNDNNQTILLINDYHDSTVDENKCQKQQRQEIVDFAAKNGAAVIVEDSLIYGDEEFIKSPSVHVQQSLFSQDEIDETIIDTPLNGIYSLCKIHDIDVVNVEYRFSFQRPLNIYYQFFKNKKNQILNEYKDGLAFETHYKNQIENLETTIEKPLEQIFNQFKERNCFLGDYLQQDPVSQVAQVDDVFKKVFPHWDQSCDYSQKLGIIFTVYGAAFLDLEVLHALALFKNKHLVVICAGTHHITDLKKVLLQFGYKPEKKRWRRVSSCR